MQRTISHPFLKTFLCLIVFTSGILAQDNYNPPPGVPVPPAIRLALEAKLSELGNAIKQLREIHKVRPGMLDLISDVAIYYNAVHYALVHDQFYPDNKTDDFAIAGQLLETGLKRAEALQKGQAPWTRKTGLVVRGYVSDIDGSVQPYGLVIPKSYDFDGKTPQRLDIWYHGRGNTLSELKFIDQRETDLGKLTTEKAIVLHPYGRYCNANKFAGETDTFEAIRHAGKYYRIDPERTTVRGFSMGGAVTWHMAAHHAGKWAAAAPGAGFAESAIYAKVMEKDPKPSWYEQKLYGLYDATKYAANLAQCPTIAYSGSMDPQKQAADIMAEYMKKEGLDLLHVIGEGLGHKYDDASLEIINKTVDEWTRKPKGRYPKKLEFVTYTLRYNSLLWLTVDALEEHWAEARVNAEITNSNSVALKTSNVAALTLTFPAGKAPFQQNSSVSISIDGSNIPVPGINQNKSWIVSLLKQNESWQLTPDTSSEALTKRHGLQGPIDDAFMDNFIFVIPSGRERSSELSQWVDDEFEDARIQWWRQFRGEPRVKRDIDLTPADIQSSHLILWGDPSSNWIFRRIQKSLPLEWEGNQFSLHGKLYDARNHVPVMIYPNPLNPRRYVILNSSFTFSEFSGGTNSLQIPKLPDWAVLNMTVPRSQRHPSGVKAAGFFDEHWQYKSR